MRSFFWVPMVMPTKKITWRHALQTRLSVPAVVSAVARWPYNSTLEEIRLS